MLVIDDRTLRTAGIGYAEAVALMAPDSRELVVHVTREFGPPVPQRGPVDTDIPPPPEAISLRVVAPPAPVQSVAHPPPEDRGHSLGELQQMAEAQRLHLEATGGVYTLHGALGQQSYLSLAQVHNALRLRRFS